MSRDDGTSRAPVIVSLIVGLMLMIMPLPDWLRPFRPDWLALLMIFWAMHLPRRWGVGSAWLVGIVLDVSLGTLLGQHALALAILAFITVRFHLLMRVFPLSQLALTVFALLALYQFLLFWINGVANVDAPAVNYWGPVIGGALVWPFLYAILSGAGLRLRSSG